MRYRQYIFVTLISFFSIYQIAFGQSDTRTLDSLKVHLTTATSPKEKVRTMLVISRLASKSDAKSALYYANKSFQLANEIQSDTLINKATLHLAITYLLIGNYPKSLGLYQDVIKNSLSNPNDLLTANNGIGIINYYQRDYRNAIKYYTKALSYSSTTPAEIKREKTIKVSLLNNLGIIHEEMKEFDKSNFYYTEALNICKQIKDEDNLAHILTNQGRLFHKQGKNEQALTNYLEALAVRKKNKDESGIALSFDGLGEFYYELKDYNNAESYLRDAIRLGKSTGDLLTVRRSSSNLYKLYQKQGNYKSALDFLALNKEVSDSLFNAERSNKITQLEMQFDFDKKQSEEQTRQREKELTYILAGVGLTFLLIILSLLFYLQRNKVKNSLLEQAHLKLEKENLEKGIELKNKELTTNILHLIQKNELIDHISEELLKIKQHIDEESRPAMQKVVVDLQSNLRPELLKEFEFRFQQIHEDFYDILNERFPNLSPSERKLCAFLKLNMTTKEISAITHQNIKSIEIARTRLRKKLNLTGLDYNLVVFLSQLEHS